MRHRLFPGHLGVVLEFGGPFTRPSSPDQLRHSVLVKLDDDTQVWLEYSQIAELKMPDDLVAHG